MTAVPLRNAPGALQSWLLDSLATVPSSSDADRAVVRQMLRDSVSVALAGSHQAPVRWACSQLSTRARHDDGAAIWTTGGRADRQTAALVNATSVQAFEFDDIAPALAAHLSSVVVPTLGAFADEIDRERAFDGVVTGLRVAAAVAPLIGFASHARGLQPTHTLGPLIAVAATGHALGFTRQQHASAIAMAVCGSLGVRANTGVRVKPMQSGFAAAAAVRAVELARVAPDDAVGQSVLDGVFSLLGADMSLVGQIVTAPLPEPVHVAVKPFPTAGAAHPSAEVLIGLRSRFADGTVPDNVEVRVPPRILTAMSFERPRLADEASWSIRYILATAWEQGRVDIADFTDDAVRESSARRDPSWLHVVPDAGFDRDGEETLVTVRAGDRVESGGVTQRLGYPGRPLTPGQLRAKFDRCLEFAGRSDDSDALWTRLAEDPFVTLETLGG